MTHQGLKADCHFSSAADNTPRWLWKQILIKTSSKVLESSCHDLWKDFCAALSCHILQDYTAVKLYPPFPTCEHLERLELSTCRSLLYRDVPSNYVFCFYHPPRRYSDSQLHQSSECGVNYYLKSHSRQSNAGLLPSTCLTHRRAYFRVFNVVDLLLCLFSGGRWRLSSFRVLITSFWVLALADSWLLYVATHMHSRKSVFQQ